MRNKEGKNGGGAGTRTPDTGIMIPLLYQLSYTATGEFDRWLKYSITAFLSRKTVAGPRCRGEAGGYSLNRVSSLWIFSISSFCVLHSMQYRARGLTSSRLMLISLLHSSQMP